ncbi:CBS domain-containing protein CBSCBSPB3 [Sesamum angolense]|uniref:CBS domain-containing protein CBSCBSPB3 n=1 Tax=Sesamum angolense TaxID=2727404 RepID=A0AAE2BQ71_9LAMI|nr:CBS domain-containing protein CBSCBSPB3 [Sesamum angolense]
MSGPPAPPAPRRNSMAQKRSSSSVKKSSASSENGSVSNGANAKPSSPSNSVTERTVKKLRLSKALTIPEGTTVSDACRRMAARRVDAVLLTDANALLSGIVTDKDIATRVIAEELRPDQTVISKVMTRNPIFVNADSLAIEALQKMVQGKFRHLPVVENGEVIALLDIKNALYDAISRMEKAAEQGSAIAAAAERCRTPIWKQFLCKVHFLSISPSALIENILRERMPPSLLYPLSSPEISSLQLYGSIRFLFIVAMLKNPALCKDGGIAACLDVLQITHAAISMVESSSGTGNDIANTVLQNFWDSALNLEPPDDFDTHSDMSMPQYATSEGVEPAKSTYPSLGLGNSFSFKFKDQKGRVHRFNFGTDSLSELVSAVTLRVGASSDQSCPQLLYEDDEGDKVLLTTDGDLLSAVTHARSAGQKILRLHLEYYESSQETTKPSSETIVAEKGGTASLRYGIFAGAVALTSIGVLVYLKRSTL